LGLMTFTLGLSGWTANDWSRLGNFDLMAPRAEVDEFTRKRVFDALGETWCESATSLSGRLGIDSALVQGALSAYAQAGRVIFDLSAGVYRKRELSRDPLPLSALRFQNDREDKANRFVEANLVKNLRFDATPNGMAAEGTVMDDAKRYQARLVVDRDERLAEANCECFYYQRNKLFKGPCEHILAVRIAHRREHGQGHS
nr:SWIM zinc finger domain-containing protein [Gammaproteobacteria bacterium]